MHRLKTLAVALAASLLMVSAFAQPAVSVMSSGTTNYGSNAKAGKFASIRGFRMYYEIYGVGKPLLFIHGNGGSINNFKNQIPYFARNYKVIAVDSRAQGKSADTSDSLTYEMMADDFNALLNQLHLDSCYVVGWSDGGIDGLLLAMRHPEKVKKLAITGANLWPDTTAIEPGLFQSIVATNDSLAKVSQTPAVKAQKKLLNLMALHPHLSTADLKQVRCPTLVIGGDHDVILPKHTLVIAEAIPKGYLWILPNSGHSTLIHYKDLFNQVVGDFFKTPYRKINGMAKLE
ncbi:alpha/beta fold hydrolase [Spirosoma endophyticum]|uniref:Pimeloyl-ACP methyl ester carboxylesterase n=1 Tax=Spirosoma endophyticum TaxID=662367 RepID=A0A1I2CSB8_9BACT|nr:alpha/beta hydrolase [Spirosoma endophyticum]SFE71062.1 Pimeloyl-ACP methyl ester carboxylesterase [Spirosoma endophyticum]